ncbi:8968_t:CDS:2, partial [Funneliformis caledonium]
MPSDPDNPLSEMYMDIIIQSVFSKKERTHINAVWTQSVLKVIFDEKYILTKINAEVVDSWIEALTDTKQQVIMQLREGEIDDDKFRINYDNTIDDDTVNQYLTFFNTLNTSSKLPDVNGISNNVFIPIFILISSVIQRTRPPYFEWTWTCPRHISDLCPHLCPMI